MTPQQLVSIARGMIGVRFAHQGRNEEEGLDCLGFLFAVAREADVTLNGVMPETYDRRDYGARPDTDFLKHMLGSVLMPVCREAMAVGDIVLLHIDGRPQHLALVSDYQHGAGFGMIHAYAPARRVVEHQLDDTWQQAIAGVYRLPSFQQ